MAIRCNTSFGKQSKFGTWTQTVLWNIISCSTEGQQPWSDSLGTIWFADDVTGWLHLYRELLETLCLFHNLISDRHHKSSNFETSTYLVVRFEICFKILHYHSFSKISSPPWSHWKIEKKDWLFESSIFSAISWLKHSGCSNYLCVLTLLSIWKLLNKIILFLFRFFFLFISTHCEGVWKMDGVTSLLLKKQNCAPPIPIKKNRLQQNPISYKAEILEHLNMSWQEQWTFFQILFAPSRCAIVAFKALSCSLHS